MSGLLEIYIKHTQIRGIKNSRNVFSTLPDYTEVIFDKHDISYTRMLVPQIYNKENFPVNFSDKNIDLFRNKVGSSDFVVFSHMRHNWVFDKNMHTLDTWENISKRNNWLIEGFRSFLHKSPAHNPKLILIEWGENVDESKKLINSLNMDNNVIWLPILPRRSLYYILKFCCDMGVGEFGSYPQSLWGSTGWECFSVGVPCMLSVNFTEYQFHKLFGYSLPPAIFDIHSADDVTNSMFKCFF